MNAQLKPTTTTSVRVYRDHWKALHAETKIMLDDTKQLLISTSKSLSGMLVTSAYVGHIKDGMISFMPFQDFNESRVAQSRPSRVTEKVILEQHNSIDFDAVTQRAKAFYHIL